MTAPRPGDPRPGDPSSGDPRSGDPRSGDPGPDQARPGEARPGDPRPDAPRPGSACPICARPAAPRYRPFCSRRCADVDLGRWLTGGYALPGPAADDELPEGSENPARPLDSPPRRR